MKRFSIILLTAIMLTGCGNAKTEESTKETEQVSEVEESQAEESQTEESQTEGTEAKETQAEEQNVSDDVQANSDSTVLASYAGEVDGSKFSIGLYDGADGKGMFATATGKTDESASIILATLITYLTEPLDSDSIQWYKILVNANDKPYVMISYSNDKSAIIGTNNDGSAAINKMPDWVKSDLSELTMTEDEIQSIVDEIGSELNNFANENKGAGAD